MTQRFEDAHTLELPDKVTCQTPEQLLASKDFKRFLATYNKQNPDKKIASVQDLAQNFNMATELYNFWLQTEAKGQVKVIADIHGLVQKCLEQVKRVDKERQLENHEIQDRFGELKVLILSIVEDWRKFYEKSGYSKEAKSIDGQDNNFYLPNITEGEMQAFEKAFASGKIDRVMLDDDRVPFAGTYNKFSPSKTMADTFTHESMIMVRAIDPKGLPTTDTKTLYKQAQRQVANRGIRLVGYKSELPPNHQHTQVFKDEIAEDETMDMMDIGTVMRLLAYLQKEHQRDRKLKKSANLKTDYQAFTEYDESVGGYQVDTLANGVFPNGEVARVKHLLRGEGKGHYFKIDKVSPTKKQFPAVVRKVVQTRKY